MRPCWCGNKSLEAFSPEYGKCGACGTLVYLKETSPDELLVRDDEQDYYGKKYWLEHQQEAFGYADIRTRAKNDLGERNLHWLKALLKYRLPPAKTLELGCAHGSFVALLQWAGFQSAGVEMSPWVISFGHEAFGVQIYRGPAEALDIPPASFDVIALMDVLEHLPDPMGTMRRCLELLKPDGLLLLQTPSFKEDLSYEDLVGSKDRFLEMLIPLEHIYLFSPRSVTMLFREIGAEHIKFETAIFPHYDMFFAVSRLPLPSYSPDEAEAALLRTPNGRLTLALLDVRQRELDVASKLSDSEVDRAARAEQIATLTGMLRESEADRLSRALQIDTLTEMLRVAEADRLARGEQIQTLTLALRDVREQRSTLTVKLSDSEEDRVARAGQIAALTEKLRGSEADRPVRIQQIEMLTGILREAETDRLNRAEQIEALKFALRDVREHKASLVHELSESEKDKSAGAKQVASLTEKLRESEADRPARARQIEALNLKLREVEADHVARGAQIETMNMVLAAVKGREAELTRQIGDLERDRTSRAEQVQALARMLRDSEADRLARAKEIATLTKVLRDTEDDRLARVKQIEAMTADLRALYSHSAFRLLGGAVKWPELEKLAKQIDVPK